MVRKILIGCLLVGFALTCGGCVALVAGAGAGGTVLWQGGKVISEEKASRDHAVSAVKATFSAKRITLTEEVKRDEVIQLRGEDPSHTKVAVDVFETGPRSVRIEIRVGIAERAAARELLSAIKKRL